MTPGRASAPTAAFFDVDHTVTRSSSLESFVRFFAERPGGERVAAGLPELVAFAAGSSDLTEIHQRFAALFQGLSWSAVRSAGEAWYEVTPDFLRSSVVGEIRRHQAEGRDVVFVSGSWAACLDPIAQHLGVSTVLRSEPALDADGDTLTGSFAELMLGSRKAEAVAETRFDLSRSFAYGDDPSDVPLLAAVGNPVAVGTNERLAAVARANGWRIIPS